MFFGFQGGVRCLQFDDEKIVSGSWDMTIMVCVFLICQFLCYLLRLQDIFLIKAMRLLFIYVYHWLWQLRFSDGVNCDWCRKTSQSQQSEKRPKSLWEVNVEKWEEKKKTNKNWTKSVPQAQGSERELFVRKTNSATDLFGRRSFVFLFSVIFPIMRKPSFNFFVFHTNSWVLWF